MIMIFCQIVFVGKSRSVINIIYVIILERLFSNIKWLLSSSLRVEVLRPDLHRDFCVSPSNSNPPPPHLKHFLSFEFSLISLCLLLVSTWTFFLVLKAKSPSCLALNREAAYLAACEQTFSIDIKNMKEPQKQKLQSVPMVSYRMIAYALI